MKVVTVTEKKNNVLTQSHCGLQCDHQLEALAFVLWIFDPFIVELPEVTDFRRTKESQSHSHNTNAN